MALTGAALALAAAAPLLPDGDEAREWAERELADPVYDAARPTLLDRAAQAVAEWFASLFDAEVPGTVGPALALVAAAVIALAIIAAFVVWGLPRASARAGAAPLALFGEDEVRSARRLRADAEAEAARGRWDAAVVLRFRALARGTVERGVVATPPGATVHAFARAAARVFPASGDELERAATAFDDVRYLRRPGTAQLYRLVADADDRIVAARPVVLEDTLA